jgi:hypothetical protein
MYTNYQSLLEAHLSDSLTQPLEKLSDADHRIIEIDLERDVGWFTNGCTKLSVSEDHRHEAPLHARRILALIALLTPSLSYLQCYNRYVFVSYLLGICVCAANGFPTAVGEAVAFFLTQKFLALADIRRQLDAGLSSADADALDAECRKALPDLMAILRADRHGASEFSRRWKLVWFADEHEMSHSWIIWDAIIAQSDNLPEFINDLCVAHLSQVQQPIKRKGKTNAPFLETVAQYRAWRRNEIVNYAVARFNARQWRIRLTRYYNIAVAVLVALVFLWLFWGRFRENE